jgi:SsrA-binding protein
MFEFAILCAFAPKRETARIKNDVGSRNGGKPAKARKVRQYPESRLLVLPLTPCYSQRSKSLMTAAKEEKVLATNRAAFHDYHISTKYEAGAALLGTEVKSVLDGRIQLKDSYVGVREGEAWLFNAHISPYTHGNRENHDPLRTRKLLLHRKEIDKLDQAAATEGMTLVVTRVYIKGRRIKFEVGVAKGKKLYDKRETELRRIVDRETRAQLKQRNR